MIFTLLYRLLFVLSFVVLLFPNAKAQTEDQQRLVALRKIGHEFLLEKKDSISPILPIKKIDGRYVMQFERDFSYEPETLISAAFNVLEESKLDERYIVEVEKCGTNEVVHSFEVSLDKNDTLTSCMGRALPKDCYVFYFTVIESKQHIATVEQKENSAYLYAILIFILLASGAVYLYRKKRSSNLSSGLINIGQYQFDQKGMMLILKTQSIELSSKESDLLFLLFTNENKTLEREYILNKVWGDGGDYVGRTLDVFISKLRKKLVADSTLKIINIRGVGYRFVIN